MKYIIVFFITVGLISFSLLVVMNKPAYACYHQPNCIKNCLRLPKWEQFFCMIGSTRH